MCPLPHRAQSLGDTSYVSVAQPGNHEQERIPTSQDFTLGLEDSYEDLYDEDYLPGPSGEAGLSGVPSSGHTQGKTSGMMSEDEEVIQDEAEASDEDDEEEPEEAEASEDDEDVEPEEAEDGESEEDEPEEAEDEEDEEEEPEEPNDEEEDETEAESAEDEGEPEMILPQPNHTMDVKWNWESVTHPFIINGELQIPAALPPTFLLISHMKTANMYHHGHIFGCYDAAKGTGGDEPEHNYRCLDANCPARLKTRGWTHIYKEIIGHTNHPEPKVIDFLVRWYLQISVRKAPHLENSKLIEQALRQLSHTQRQSVAAKNSLQHLVARIKKQTCGYVAEPKVLDAINTSLHFRTTSTGQLFLLFDKTIEDNVRILAYATTANIRGLVQSPTWLVDGTFHVAPAFFKQLWVIHARVDTEVFPMAFFLFNGKTAKMYSHVLKFLKAELDKVYLEDRQAGPVVRRQPRRSCSASQPQQEEDEMAEEQYPGPTHIVLDFEAAQAKAFLSLFAGAKVQGCFFHFRQAINRKVRSCAELRKLRAKDGTMECRITICMYVALAFISEKDVRAGCKDIRKTNYYVANQEAFAEFTKYFEGYWSGAMRTIRSGPPANKIPWNVHDAVLNDELKTTSALEGWHSAMATRTGRSKPDFRRFYKILCDEQKIAMDGFTDVSAGLPPPAKKAKKQSYQERLKELVTRGYTKTTRASHLRRLALNLNRFCLKD